MAYSLPSLPSRDRRDAKSSTNTTIPAPISIAPSQYWDGNDGPWSSFPLQLGENNQAQNVRVLVSTAGYNTWVISNDGCPYAYVSYLPTVCSDSRGFLYQYNKSSTYVKNSIFNTQIESNLGLDTTGTAGYETVTLGWQGSGGPVVQHSTFFQIADSNFWIGLFGVNPQPTNFTDFNNPDPSFMQQLFAAGKIPSRAYAYTAGNQYQLGGMKIFGSLILGGYDANRMVAGKNLSWPFYEDVERDLLVTVNTISTSSGSPSNLLPDGPIQIFIDSTVPTIWLPESACTAFEAAFGLQWDENFQRYLVNGSLHSKLLASNPSVTFTLSNGAGIQDFVLPYGAFDLNVSYPIVVNDQGNTSYYFPLQRAANESQYTLGRTFLQEAYLIADYDRSNFTLAPCNWNLHAVQNTEIKSILNPNITLPSDSNSNGGGSTGISTGAIAGIVVAIIALVAILGLILFFLRRKKLHRERSAAAALAAAEAETNDKASSNSSEGQPFISRPLGDELGGAEVHEMGAPNKPWMAAQEMENPHKTDPSKNGYSEMDGGGVQEVQGDAPVFEMEGIGVHELDVPVGKRRVKP